MCGLAGYAGIKSPETRLLLVAGLGEGIDIRGGDAVGFVSVNDRLSYGRKIGTWTESRLRFIRSASRGSVCMMHARFATCGKKDAITQAHPFRIERNGRTVLFGAHNGIIWDARESAEKHNRPYTVDSRELFELLADNAKDEIQKLTGYGVITWVEPGDKSVHMIRLSKDSEMEIVAVEGGGVVWASTYSILKEACEFAKLDIQGSYALDEVGVEFILSEDRVSYGGRKGISVGSGWGGWENYLPKGRWWEKDDVADAIDHRDWDAAYGRYLKEDPDEWLEKKLREVEEPVTKPATFDTDPFEIWRQNSQ